MPDRAMLTLIIIAFWRAMVGGAIEGRHRGYRARSGNCRGGMSVSLADGSVVLLWHDAICARVVGFDTEMFGISLRHFVQ